MIEEVINDIRQAEEEGAKIVSDSAADAKVLLVNAEAKADELKRQAAQNVKENTKNWISDAEAKATLEREKIIADGKADAEKLIKAKEKKTDEVADFLLAEYLKKYGVKNPK